MTPSQQILTPKQDVGGLSHLVEAATALSELVDLQHVSAAVSSAASKKVASNAVVSDDDEHRQLKPAVKAKKREIFPQRLMEILSNPALTEVISWLPHGRSFVIIRPDIFTDHVLPQYMSPVDSRASTKYPSFTRKLNRWGFRQATRGPDTGAFHHSLFRRHQPDLCLQMVCQKSRERQASHLRSLPPKKRSVSERASSHESLTHLQQGPMTSLDPISPSIASVSADDRSVTSFANSTTSSFAASRSEVLVNPLATVVFTGKGDMGLVPFILNDSALVAKTLQRRDTLEVVRAAKAMLHEAYMKALRGEGV